MVQELGLEWELLLPPVVSTSTPTKANVAVPELDISDVSDIDDDDNNITDITQSSVYLQTTSASEPESDVPVEKQRTYLIFESALLTLLSICFMCRSTYTSIEKVTIGSFLCIKQICHHCSNKYVWESQPYVGKIPVGNILISAAILYVHGIITSKGITSIPKLELCNNHKEDIFSTSKSFFYNQLSATFGRRTRDFNQSINGQNIALVLGGDGREDSPGHSAKYGSYSGIDLKQSKVVDINLVQV